MAKSLAINSLLVYGQRLSTALITFFATPVILANLGVEDYGIYTLTLGLVAMFNLLNWSLTAATQRFIAVSLGEGKEERIRAVFANGFYIHAGYGLLLLLIIFTVGVWFTGQVLNIPPEKVGLAGKVIIFVGFVAFFEMLLIPFEGLLKAYEHFGSITILGISRSLLKLLAAFLLYVSPVDELLFLAMLSALSTLLVLAVIWTYSIRSFDFISLSIVNYDRNVINELFAFMGWNMIGAFAIMGRNQGLAIIINLFFGVIANAAYGIATQVQAAVSIFSQGVVTALSPRIMKAAGNGDINQMLRYSNITAKYGFLTLSFIAVPLFINMPVILNLWLDEVPVDASIFAQLIMLFVLTTALSSGIQSVFLAINKVKVYHLTVSPIILLNIPVGISLFLLGFPSYSILVVSICLELVAFLVRLFMLKKYLKVSILANLKEILITMVFPVFIALLVAFVPVFFMLTNNVTYNLILSTMFGVITLILLMVFVSFSSIERLYFMGLINDLKNKVLK